jgi:hypothetical protein
MKNKMIHFTPLVSHLRLLFFALILSGCTGKMRDNTTPADSTQVVQEAYAPVEQAAAAQPDHADSVAMKKIIEGLSAIEKFAVLEDYYLLSSLLKFKGDSLLYEKVIAVLSKRGDFIERYDINLLDTRSGYINYGERGADIDYIKTYWNLKDGYKLVATEEWVCSTVCDSNLRFQKFKDGTYQTIESTVMIPGMERLAEILAPDSKDDGEPDEFRFVLPQKGQNIMFCLDKTCIELKWNGEIFEIRDEKKSITN